MEETKEEISRRDIAGVFDEILGRHMERLLGSRFGIAGLPLNLGTVACLLLLADQVGEGPNTLENMVDRLTEIGVNGVGDTETLLRDMIEKGYVLEYEGKRIVAGKPAMSMAQVLERLFPKMPGMNLVAYVVQTIDEVTTGRKALEAALVQFDQTLKMQGVPLRQKHGSTAQAPPQVPAQAPSSPRPQESARKKLPRVPCPFETKSEKPGGIRIIGSSTDSLHWEHRDVEVFPVPSPETLSSPPRESEEGPTEELQSCVPAAKAPSVPMETEDAASSLSGTPMEFPLPESPPEFAEMTEEASSPGPTGQGLPSPPEGRQVDEEMPPAECEESPEKDFAVALPEEITEDLIEREVFRFEEELAAQCPLCQKGKVHPQKTPTGKVYYRCENRECSFISWGKPYHQSCPRCGNPFLVEVTDGQGNRILRCPRATCRYRQTGLTETGDKPTVMQDPASATPRRRVVRRRVVRRKR